MNNQRFDLHRNGTITENKSHNQDEYVILMYGKKSLEHLLRSAPAGGIGPNDELTGITITNNGQINFHIIPRVN